MLSHLKAVLRTILGALLLAAFWFLIGWGWLSWQAGAGLAIFSLVVGPLLMPPLVWLYFRWRRKGGLQRLNVRPDPALSAAYLRNLLHVPGPRPRLWILFSKQVACFWFERSLFGPGRQVLVVSSAWLAQSPEQKVRDWDLLWKRMASHTPFERRLRSVQIALWFGGVFVAEVLALLLKLLLRQLGFRHMPTPAFWLQRVGWALRGFWFGLPSEPRLNLRVTPRGESPQLARAWNSLLLGPWTCVAHGRVHPLWPVLMHSEAFLAEAPKS